MPFANFNLLPADLLPHIVSFLLLESLAHCSLRINKAFRDATRKHIKFVVLPAILPLREAPFNIPLAKMLSTLTLVPNLRRYGLEDMKVFASAIAMGSLASLSELCLNGYHNSFRREKKQMRTASSPPSIILNLMATLA